MRKVSLSGQLIRLDFLAFDDCQHITSKKSFFPRRQAPKWMGTRLVIHDLEHIPCATDLNWEMFMVGFMQFLILSFLEYFSVY